ncbi:type II toxin-antitoxin system RelE/ParE family toxin [Thiocapsa sp.]|uniref:type II toxin-antitoxin system RelE/ParE family toxin n=1 Tax=Thiocapsa sp. TaxID=2024551 RepID=UPI0035941D52
MAVVRRTAGAEEDLVDIWLYIAADNPHAADLLLEKIDRTCMLLAGNPLLGRARPEIAPRASLSADRQLSHPVSRTRGRRSLGRVDPYAGEVSSHRQGARLPRLGRIIWEVYLSLLFLKRSK